MSRLLLILSVGLGLCAGCRHVDIPTLPASHGHLALSMNKYQGSPAQPTFEVLPRTMPEVVVESAQAPAVFAEAVQVLRGSPTEVQTMQAWADLSAACEAELEEACVFLRDAFKPPGREEMKPMASSFKPEASKPFSLTILSCRIKTDGSVRDCEVVERAPNGLTEAILASLRTARYRAATVAGHPVEVSYTFVINTVLQGARLTPEERLAWARLRVEDSPRSAQAWRDLSHLLAELAPEAPGYVPALRQLHELMPKYWWAANELAWMHVQAGRTAEAAPLVQRARKGAMVNPYVLETSAAVLFGQGQCEQAVAEQQRAVEKLPAEWPAPERERFLRSLREYQQRCPAGTSTP